MNNLLNKIAVTVACMALAFVSGACMVKGMYLLGGIVLLFCAYLAYKELGE